MRVAWALSDRGLAFMAAASGLRLGCTWPDAVDCLREGMEVTLTLGTQVNCSSQRC
jgi:hypothetical protein